jgi:ribonucleoside-diphosphate reductase alpha chain
LDITEDIREQMLSERYYQEGESWELLCRRVAHCVAQGEAGKGKEELFYEAMVNKMFLPNSPTLMNAGLEDGTLSACFTVDVEDSMESIMDTLKEMALISKAGGGIGCNWSKLRPKGSKVNSTNGVASGAVSFLDLVNTMGDVVVQGGRRRVAVISILNADHPDIKEFITVKNDRTKLNNMNMSVMVNNDFMRDVYAEEPKAKEIWDLIVEQAWATGEPGLLFYDRINADNIDPDNPITVSNPCAEVPMIPYSSCNLISINLATCVKDNTFNWDLFKNLIRLAVDFADAVIDVNKFPLPKIEEVSKSLRQIGVGIMGWSHALIKLGISYGSTESYEFADDVAKCLYETSLEESQDLGRKLGTFPLCKCLDITNRRNSYLNSLAPTGSISVLGGCSFGIEPLFALAYKRKVMGKEFIVVDPLFEEELKKYDVRYDRIIELVLGKSSIQDIEEIPIEIRRLFITAHDLTPKQHIEIVSIFQSWIDTGISKTINVPNGTTLEEVDKLLKYAYRQGCKGITIYRNGSRDAPISLETEDKKPLPTEELMKIDTKAPDITWGLTRRIKTGCGHYHCTISGDGKPLKVFINATTRGCKANLEAIGRLCSLLLRMGVDKELILKQLSKIICDSCISSDRSEVKSCADGVAQTIRLYSKGEIPNELPSYDDEIPEISSNILICPECGEEYIANIRCSTCTNCGYSKCL